MKYYISNKKIIGVIKVKFPLPRYMLNIDVRGLILLYDKLIYV
ncbi:hypothetical protein CLH_0279 [Clostridium botulinum E3 str. Alaska E43]|nr:hypothetical protein CLH_0279 [Clostridium botulinum E3 str. Alaska E43]